MSSGTSPLLWEIDRHCCYRIDLVSWIVALSSHALLGYLFGRSFILHPLPLLYQTNAVYSLAPKS